MANDSGHVYRPGDRILVSGGYEDEASAWLKGGKGYSGTIMSMTANTASVELDRELVLDAGEGKTWQDFGAGSSKALRESRFAKGRWLVILLGYVGATWHSPIMQLQVGLCEAKPDLAQIPPGGGAGYWVESHAQCSLFHAGS